MKINIGSVVALYPIPVTIIGAMNGEKPTWTTVTHVGVIGHDRVLISLAASHFINRMIKETKKLSISIVNELMLQKTDNAGAISGAKEDKSTLFNYEMGEAGTPVIEDAPLTMECSVVDIYQSPGFENFICTIDNTYVEEEHINDIGKINYQTLNPVLFEYPTFEYIKTGEVIGACLSSMKK